MTSNCGGMTSDTVADVRGTEDRATKPITQSKTSNGVTEVGALGPVICKPLIGVRTTSGGSTVVVTQLSVGAVKLVVDDVIEAQLTTVASSDVSKGTVARRAMSRDCPGSRFAVVMRQ